MFVAAALSLPTKQPCRLRKFAAGYVCVCTEDYCDTLSVPKQSADNEWMLVTSTESGERFNYSYGEFHNTVDAENSTDFFIEMNRNILHQEIFGFGGSITGAVSYILSKLPKSIQECIFKSYYTNDDGLGYSMMRMPIGGCDFDLEPWAYNEQPENDRKLSNFTKLHAKDILRTNQIKQLMNVSHNYDVKIIGVTWSPPRWMKVKGDWPGAIDNQLKREYYQTWAEYHLNWLDLMHSAGIPIWAISTGNEPYFAQHTSFMGLSWNDTQQHQWIAQHLGPTLKHSKHSNVQIHGFDDNRDMLLSWLNQMNATGENAMKYILAVGIHGYTDRISSPNILDEFKRHYPDKMILYTEMCFGVTGPLSRIGPTLGSWHHFENLTNMLMQNLNRNVNGFVANYLLFNRK